MGVFIGTASVSSSAGESPWIFKLLPFLGEGGRGRENDEVSDPLAGLALALPSLAAPIIQAVCKISETNKRKRSCYPSAEVVCSVGLPLGPGISDPQSSNP